MVSLKGLDAIKIMPSRKRGRILLLVVAVLLFISPALAKKPTGSGSPATDPGFRGGPAGAGASIIIDQSSPEYAFFSAGLAKFNEVESVSGTIAGTGSGLGPRFNLDSCAGCHAYPAVGGTSPPLIPPWESAGRGCHKGRRAKRDSIFH